MEYALKVAISAILIVIIAEVSKKSPLLGGLLASLPAISFLAIIFLYAETKDIQKVSALCTHIFWLVLPSLSFFIAMPLLLKKLNFTMSMIASTAIMLVVYSGMVFVLKKYGVSI